AVAAGPVDGILIPAVQPVDAHGPVPTKDVTVFGSRSTPAGVTIGTDDTVGSAPGPKSISTGVSWREGGWMRRRDEALPAPALWRAVPLELRNVQERSLRVPTAEPHRGDSRKQVMCSCFAGRPAGC